MALTTTNPDAPLYGDYRDFAKGGRYGPSGAEAPKQIGTEGGRPKYDYWETDPEKVNAYLSSNSNDPKLVAAAQQGDKALDHELHSRGIRVPEHYKAAMGQDGKVIVKEMSWWDKHKNWAIPALGMAGAIAGPAALSALSGGGGSAAPLASTQVGTGFVPAVGGTAATTAGGATVATGAGGALASSPFGAGLSSTLPAGTSSTLGSSNMGFWSQAGKWAMDRGKGMAKDYLTDKGTDLIGQGLGDYAQGAAHNRGTQAELEMDVNNQLEQHLLQREEEKRRARSDAYRNSVLGSHTVNFKPAPRPGYMLPSYTTGSTAEQIAAGRTLQQQGADRLAQSDLTTPGGMPDYRNLSTDEEFNKLKRPGIMERVAGWGSIAAPVIGGIMGKR